MKAAFFLAVAQGKHSEVLSSLGELKTVHFEGLNIAGRPYMVIKIAQGQRWTTPSSAKTGLWDLVLLVPNFDDSEASLKRFRLINKMKITDSKTLDLAGPFDLETVDKQFPDLPIEILHNENGELRCPHVFAGDSPETMAKLAYVPTEKDCNDDVKSVESIVWAKVIAVEPEPTPIKIIEEDDEKVIEIIK